MARKVESVVAIMMVAVIKLIIFPWGLTKPW